MSRPANSRQQDKGQANSHQDVDNKDERSLANRAEAERKHEKEEEARENAPKPDPTAAALSHGNQPSKGAVIDSTIEQEEAAELAKKDAAKAQSEAAKK